MSFLFLSIGLNVEFHAITIDSSKNNWCDSTILFRINIGAIFDEKSYGIQITCVKQVIKNLEWNFIFRIYGIVN